MVLVRKNSQEMNDTFDEAKKSMEVNVEEGQTFMVRDLFIGAIWNRINKYDRIELGKRFYQYSIKQGRSLVEPTEKTSQNQQKYEKKVQIKN
jgi:hypothetical protein